MATSFLNSILSVALKTAAGTPKKKMMTATTAKTATAAAAQAKSAAAVAKNLSPKMKAALNKIESKPLPTPKGWTRTNDVSYSSN